MENSIYITYNPNSTREQNLAMDLFQKGRQNGYFIYLPERTISSYKISKQTCANIDAADWFVVYSTTQLSEAVKEEIQYALNKKNQNQIIVIYSSHFGKNIEFGDKKPIELFVNDYDLNSIEKFKDDLFGKINQKKKIPGKKGASGLEILLGVGAALLLLSALNSDKEK